MNAAEGPKIDAAAWLRQTLANGAAVSAQLKGIAAQVGIGPKALRNARERIGVVVTRHGNGATMRSVWSLLDEGSGIGAQTDADGIRAPAPMSTFAKVAAEFGAPSLTAPDKPSKRWRIADSALARVPPRVHLTNGERRRTEARINLFIRRGLTRSEAQQVAASLVERDRSAGHAVGSCIECQNFVRGGCPVQQPVALIHECWSRRHDAP